MIVDSLHTNFFYYYKNSPTMTNDRTVDFEVNIKPSFTLRCGNNTSQALDPYEFYKFNETFNVKVNL